MVPPTTSTSPRISSTGMKLPDFLSISISAAKSSGSALAGVTGCDFASSLTLGSITVGIVSPLWGVPRAQNPRPASMLRLGPDFACGVGGYHAGLRAALHLQYGPCVPGRSERHHWTM